MTAVDPKFETGLVSSRCAGEPSGPATATEKAFGFFSGSHFEVGAAYSARRSFRKGTDCVKVPLGQSRITTSGHVQTGKSLVSGDAHLANTVFGTRRSGSEIGDAEEQRSEAL